MIAVPSIAHRVNAAITLLSHINLRAPGYDSNLDSEIWDWVDREDIIAAHKDINEVIMELLHVNQRLVSKLSQAGEE